MTARIIKTAAGRKLGECAAAPGPRAKTRAIDQIEVYADPARHGRITLKVAEAQRHPFVFLSLPAAIEVAKGILANLPDVYIAADDELLAILHTAVNAADREARAVAQVVKDRTDHLQRRGQ